MSRGQGMISGIFVLSVWLFYFRGQKYCLFPSVETKWLLRKMVSYLNVHLGDIFIYIFILSFVIRALDGVQSPPPLFSNPVILTAAVYVLLCSGFLMLLDCNDFIF